MSARTWWLMAAGLGLVGCGGSETRRYAFDLAPTTRLLALDIENFRGSVEVRADARTDRPEVIATARAARSLGEFEGAALYETWTDASLEDESTRAVLRVRTGSPREDTGDHWVDLVVRVPHCEGLRIVNAGGTVLAVGTGGGTEITNHLGPVEFRTAEPVNEPVTITTTDASIFFQVPTGSAGEFDLATLEGIVRFRDRVAGTGQAYVAPGVHKASVGEGDNTVVLRTNRGDINAWIDEDPVALTRLVRRGFPDPRDFWFLQGSRRHKRNLPDDHREVTRQSAATLPYGDSY